MTYEYVCGACGKEWEAEQSINDPPLKDCPDGHVNMAKRQVSGGAGFILKGGGWYADGYGSSSKKSEAASSPAKSDDSGSKTKPETKTETKPETSSTEKKSDTAGSAKGSVNAA